MYNFIISRPVQFMFFIISVKVESKGVFDSLA